MNQHFELGLIGARECPRVGKSREQRWCDHVDAFVGRLCGQDRAHQQLVGIAMIDLAGGIWPGVRQRI